MMMTPEQQAELDAKARPLLEKLVEVLNELNEISEPAGCPTIAGNNEIITAAGSVIYRRYAHKWEIGGRR